jgi:hypothetical protein
MKNRTARDLVLGCSILIIIIIQSPVRVKEFDEFLNSLGFTPQAIEMMKC